MRRRTRLFLQLPCVMDTRFPAPPPLPGAARQEQICFLPSPLPLTKSQRNPHAAGHASPDLVCSEGAAECGQVGRGIDGVCGLEAFDEPQKEHIKGGHTAEQLSCKRAAPIISARGDRKMGRNYKAILFCSDPCARLWTSPTPAVRNMSRGIVFALWFKGRVVQPGFSLFYFVYVGGTRVIGYSNVEPPHKANDQKKRLAAHRSIVGDVQCAYKLLGTCPPTV